MLDVWLPGIHQIDFLDSGVLLSINSFVWCPALNWLGTLQLMVTITGQNNLCTSRNMLIPTWPCRDILLCN